MSKMKKIAKIVAFITMIMYAASKTVAEDSLIDEIEDKQDFDTGIDLDNVSAFDYECEDSS